ncbi:hypothetical protein GCM10023322_48100 [Rugosimonospora acidiphila]|uniref:Uncharacterized protein n=1 Tax=Rugosimonospora acidiphila TaxID=556531 RepID=A0ABP9S5A2_9ACTN
MRRGALTPSTLAVSMARTVERERVEYNRVPVNLRREPVRGREPDGQVRTKAMPPLGQAVSVGVAVDHRALAVDYRASGSRLTRVMTWVEAPASPYTRSVESSQV